MDRRLRHWLPVLVVVLALALGAVAAAGPGITGRVLPPPEPQEGAEAPPPTAAPVFPDPGGGGVPQESRALEVLAQLFAALLAVLLAGVVAYLMVLGWRRLVTAPERELDPAATQPDPAAAAEEVREVLRAGLADLDAGGDARRAIIACWLRLERVAAAAGTDRLASDTPGDLVARLLSRYQVSREALERLAGAYRLARYAPVTVDDHLVQVARRALREVDTELAPAAAPAGRT